MMYLELFIRGGIMMWPIAVCLIIALAIVVERFVAFRRIDPDPPRFLAHLRNLLRRGNRNAVLAFCENQRTVLSDVVREALPHQEEAAIQSCMERIGEEQTYLLGRRLPLLALSAILAPLLGFLGTLLGMVSALRAVELHPAFAGSGLLAGRIWVSLIPSVFGLAVGIPVLSFHLYFTARIRQVDHLLVSLRPRILELLVEPVPEEPLGPPIANIKPPVRTSRFEDDEFFRRKTDVKSR